VADDPLEEVGEVLSGLWLCMVTSWLRTWTEERRSGELSDDPG